MAARRLNDRRVDALKPRKSAYDIRDRDLKGFAVTVGQRRPSCERNWAALIATM